MKMWSQFFFSFEGLMDHTSLRSDHRRSETPQFSFVATCARRHAKDHARFPYMTLCGGEKSVGVPYMLSAYILRVIVPHYYCHSCASSPYPSRRRTPTCPRPSGNLAHAPPSPVEWFKALGNKAQQGSRTPLPSCLRLPTITIPLREPLPDPRAFLYSARPDERSQVPDTNER